MPRRLLLLEWLTSGDEVVLDELLLGSGPKLQLVDDDVGVDSGLHVLPADAHQNLPEKRRRIPLDISNDVNSNEL